MRIDLVSKSDSHRSNFVYTDFFMNRNFNLVLMTHNLEKSPLLDSINTKIMNELLDQKFEELSKNALKKGLTDFFSEMNQQLFTIFENHQSIEKGISLLLCIILPHQAFVVQFGRLVCGLIQHDLSIIGNSWENFSQKSAETLNLLGNQRSQIAIRIHEIKIEKNSYLFAIPSSIAEELIDLKNKPKKMLGHIQLLSQHNEFPYFIIKMKASFGFSKLPFQHHFRTRMIAAMMLLILIISTIYVFYGKNWLADQQNLLRVKNEAFIRNELLEKLIETQETLNQTLQEMYDFEIFPNQELEYTETKTIEFDYRITTKPVFDLRSIYFGAKNEIFCLKKSNSQMRWEKEFTAPIQQILLIDANRILLFFSEKVKCLNRETGLLLWEKQLAYQLSETMPIPFQISINRFKQLDNSIIFVPQTRGFILINNLSSEILLRYESEKKLDFISEFDQIDKALYIVQNNVLKQIRLGLK